jgi:hypothetical protein
MVQLVAIGGLRHSLNRSVQLRTPKRRNIGSAMLSPTGRCINAAGMVI